MAEVSIGTDGGATRYRISFGGAIQDWRNIEADDEIFQNEGYANGQVFDSDDFYVGPYPVEIENLDLTLFGSPPDLIVNVDGQPTRVSGGETVTFTGEEEEELQMSCSTATVPGGESGNGGNGGNGGDGSNGGNGGQDNDNQNGDSGLPFELNRTNILLVGGVVGAGALLASRGGGGERSSQGRRYRSSSPLREELENRDLSIERVRENINNG